VAPRWEHAPPTFASVEWLYSDGKCRFQMYFLIHAVAHPSRCSSLSPWTGKTVWHLSI